MEGEGRAPSAANRSARAGFMAYSISYRAWAKW